LIQRLFNKYLLLYPVIRQSKVTRIEIRDELA
jgi:hypothetical protein